MVALPPVLAFGEFELDEGRLELRRRGHVREIRPTPFRLLVYLVVERHRTVSKQELLREIWPDVVVSDVALSSAVNAVRKALDDDGKTQRWLQTRRGYGYQFVGVVEERSVTGTAPRESGRRAIRSLAVLPLENLSGDPAQEYFADGMTEALIGNLAKLGGPRVISRTSVMQYKGVRRSLPQIAEELNVDTVIEGTVTRIGGRVRVSIQLIDAVDDSHLWAEIYDRELGDVLSIQSQLARAIAEQTRIELAPEIADDLTQAHKIDPSAHDAYFKGLDQSSKFTPNSLWNAVRHFGRAIELAPDFAPAYAGLSGVYFLLAGPVTSTHQAMPKARDAALRALEIDPRLSEAHDQLGWISFTHDWDWAEGETRFRRAIQLNPSNEKAYLGYGVLLSSRGEHDAAIAMARRRVELAPLDLVGRAVYAGEILKEARRYDQAVEELRKLLKMDARFFFGHLKLSEVYAAMGRSEAMEVELTAREGLGAAPHVIAEARQEMASGGDRAAIRVLLKHYCRAADWQYLNPWEIARFYIRLGEFDQAFEWLDRAYLEKSREIVHLRVDPAVDSLRSDPRFEDLVRRMGIPQS